MFFQYIVVNTSKAAIECCARARVWDEGEIFYCTLDVFSTGGTIRYTAFTCLFNQSKKYKRLLVPSGTTINRVAYKLLCTHTRPRVLRLQYSTISALKYFTHLSIQVHRTLGMRKERELGSAKKNQQKKQPPFYTAKTHQTHDV